MPTWVLVLVFLGAFIMGVIVGIVAAIMFVCWILMESVRKEESGENDEPKEATTLWGVLAKFVNSINEGIESARKFLHPEAPDKADG